MLAALTLFRPPRILAFSASWRIRDGTGDPAAGSGAFDPREERLTHQPPIVTERLKAAIVHEVVMGHREPLLAARLKTRSIVIAAARPPPAKTTMHFVIVRNIRLRCVARAWRLDSPE
jgi:hypothetical protein